MSHRPLSERLDHYFPYDHTLRFPTYIWQTWQVDPSSGDFPEKLRYLEASWTEKNRAYVHQVLTDKRAELIVNYLYQQFPEVLEVWTLLPRPILKADFFRYLILYARGGVYSDIDTEALQPTFKWIPATIDPGKVGIMIGIEADPDRADWHDWYARRVQLCQWTIRSKPGHPALKRVILRIVNETLTRADRGNLEYESRDTMDWTGPAVWTDSVMDSINDQSDTFVDWRNLTGMKEPKLLHDILIMPITCNFSLPLLTYLFWAKS